MNVDDIFNGICKNLIVYASYLYVVNLIPYLYLCTCTYTYNVKHIDKKSIIISPLFPHLQGVLLLKVFETTNHKQTMFPYFKCKLCLASQLCHRHMAIFIFVQQFENLRISRIFLEISLCDLVYNIESDGVILIICPIVCIFLYLSRAVCYSADFSQFFFVWFNPLIFCQSLSKKKKIYLILPDC